MSRSFVLILRLFLCSALIFTLSKVQADDNEITFSAYEKHVIQSLSGEKLVDKTDPTNRVSGHPDAIAMGQELFFDFRLSRDGTRSCASCHNPTDSWSSAYMAGVDNAPLEKHTPHLWNIAQNRWFSWNGRADTLWGQALGPMEHEGEMAGSRTAIARLIQSDGDYRQTYESLFGSISDELLQSLPEQAKPLTETPNHPVNIAWKSLDKETQKAVNQVFVNTAKIIAAFEETIVSRNSPFDRFATGMKTGDEHKQQAISDTAKKGLKLFVGKAGCVQCHFGPNFSDGEFHHLFLEKRQPGLSDGRYLGVSQLMVDPFNTKSAYNDAPTDGSYRSSLDYVYRNVEFRGQFKTPSLRNVVKTAPYMHTGELGSLDEVVRYYNNISERKVPGNHQETVLTSLNLTPDEQDYLVAFLQTLTDESFLHTLSQRAK